MHPCREIKTSNVQKLMDSRYTHQFNDADEIPATVRNTQVVDCINGYTGAGQLPDLLDYMPEVQADELLNTDLHTTWAPKVNKCRSPDPKDSNLVYRDKRIIELYEEDGFLQDEDKLLKPQIAKEPIRLWPEEKKEISSLAKRISRAAKGM